MPRWPWTIQFAFHEKYLGKHVCLSLRRSLKPKTGIDFTAKPRGFLIHRGDEGSGHYTAVRMCDDNTGIHIDSVGRKQTSMDKEQIATMFNTENYTVFTVSNSDMGNIYSNIINLINNNY